MIAHFVIACRVFSGDDGVSSSSDSEGTWEAEFETARGADSQPATARSEGVARHEQPVMHTARSTVSDGGHAPGVSFSGLSPIKAPIDASARFALSPPLPSSRSAAHGHDASMATVHPDFNVSMLPSSRPATSQSRATARCVGVMYHRRTLVYRVPLLLRSMQTLLDACSLVCRDMDPRF